MYDGHLNMLHITILNTWLTNWKEIKYMEFQWIVNYVLLEWYLFSHQITNWEVLRYESPFESSFIFFTLGTSYSIYEIADELHMVDESAM